MTPSDWWSPLGPHLRRAHPLRPAMRAGLSAMEGADPERVHAYQSRRLRALVRLAARRSPFYRRWFHEAGVDPASIRTVEDLSLLPVIDRSHLARTPEDFLVAPRAPAWPARSSGTSGVVVTAYRTPGSSVYELCALERQWGWFGIPPGARRVVLRGSDVRSRTGRIVAPHPDGRRLMVSSFDLTEQHLPAILTAIDEFRPLAVEGWPSSITLLAGLLRDAGRTVPVRGVLTSSEVFPDAARALVRAVFDAPVVDHYGQTERVAMGGNCESGTMHEFADYGIVEHLPVRGEPGRHELVGTPLHNWAFPVFRYRTGDEVVPSDDGGACPCGRSLPRLGIVGGRVEDAFVAADGRHIPLPHCLVKNLTGLREVQVAQRAPGVFEFRMVPGAAFDADVARHRARTVVATLVGPGQTVTFREMASIPRSGAGKLRPTIVLDDLVR